MNALAVTRADESAYVVGKRLLTHLYIHRMYVHELPDELKILIAQALLVAGEFDYDLVKIAYDGTHVCLLSYPDFDITPHPELKYSIKVLLPSGRMVLTDYRGSTNPPILHRKELFITPMHPHYATFVRLTEAEDARKLLDFGDVGTRKQWRALLASKNLIIKGHSLTAKK